VGARGCKLQRGKKDCFEISERYRVYIVLIPAFEWNVTLFRTHISSHTLDAETSPLFLPPFLQALSLSEKNRTYQ
jgi:hypothetical protein